MLQSRGTGTVLTNAVRLILFFGVCAVLLHSFPIEKSTWNPPPKPLHRFDVGFFGGYGFSFEKLYKNGMGVGISLTYNMRKSFFLEFDSRFVSIPVTESKNGLFKGTLGMIPLQLSLGKRFPLGKKMHVFVLIGPHILVPLFSISQTEIDNWERIGMTLKDKLDIGFGGQAAIGLGILLKKTLSLNLDVRYFFNRGKGSYSITDNKTGISHVGSFSGLKFDMLIPTVGIRYGF